MPSRAASSDRGSATRLLDLVRSQGFGIACGLATTALLGIGTVILAITGDGASAGVAMDDVTAFFRPPSQWHLWFYLLIPVLGLYGLSTLLSTIDSVGDAWRAGRRTLSAYAPAALHVAFLVALVAHGIGGFWGREDGVTAVGPAWTGLPDGRSARALSVTTDEYPDGSPRQVRVDLEVRDPTGATVAAEVAYNAPLSSGGGADLLLLVRAATQPGGARLTAGPAECFLASPGDDCVIAGRHVRLLQVRTGGHWGDTPVAYFQIEGEGEPERFFLWVGAAKTLAENGASLRLAEIRGVPVVMLRSRHAPGNPWALAAAVILGLGLLAMGRRWGF